ncbi:MAG: hypothetical protein BGP04_16975 [Rhizobiales bacterium 62-17]|nr:DUF861 domain-containing protein [Hyphomicrobiales bacterium]OJY03425.1 MAG: hypothetical protein BGP04_16975 [Rhizobiales bacterium 62-17]
MSSPDFAAAALDAVVLEPAPINSDWILAGSPEARSVEVFRSADGAATCNVWDCTAGTFKWYFGVDETVHILQGEVEVTAQDGSVRVLKPGDVAFFASGTWATWRIDTYVRKLAYCRHSMPLLLAFSLRVVGKLMRMSGLSGAAPDSGLSGRKVA